MTYTYITYHNPIVPKTRRKGRGDVTTCDVIDDW